MGISCDKSSMTTKLLKGTAKERMRHAYQLAARYHNSRAMEGQDRIRVAKCREHEELARVYYQMAADLK